MAYVEGFVVPVPRDRLEDYKAMSRVVEVIFRELGALDYVECVGDDVPYGTLTSFPRAVQATEDEVVVFAWVVHPSRESRDACNKAAMDDPRMKSWEGKIPFDGKRMIFGGFVPFQGL
ncbi:MAG: DUF1428 domain-containing protein [Alphaproteobacteria bacterium]|nr:DUF1428 domain-containing protein [Alphaproteobacteria bacterium]